VAYAVYNDYYADSSTCAAAVQLIGTAGGQSGKSAASRLYESVFNVKDSTAAKKVQEKDFGNPDTSEDAHLYTGQFPVRDFTADPI
jgi:hypothetical protein